MAKSNKPVAIDIGGFMKQVQNNKPEKKDEATEAADMKVTLPEVAEEAEHVDTLPESDESSPKRGRGRPKKRNVRNQRLVFKTDKETFVRLGRIKFEEKFDLQDIIHLATIKFLDENFKKDGSAISEEAREYIKEELAKFEIK